MTLHWLTRLSDHPRSRDGIVAVAWLLCGLAALQFGGFNLWETAAVLNTDGSVYLFTLLTMVGIATQRSRFPLVALGAGSIFTVLDLLFGGSLGVVLIFTDLVYAAIKYASGTGVRAVLTVMLGVAVVTILALIFWLPADGDVLIVVIQWALIIFIATVWGWNVRSERLRTRAVMAENHAVSMQKLRRNIAHDLHDLVANQIAVAGLHVEAAKLQLARAGLEAPAVEQSLEQAARGTNRADEELRRMIRVLRAIDDLGEQPFVPVSRLINNFVESLPDQMPDSRGLTWTGAGVQGFCEALRAESESRVRLMLRVLSEFVSNAIKYGSGDVMVHVDTTTGLAIEITNTVSEPPRPERGSGIGIMGVALLLEGSGMQSTSERLTSNHWRATLTVPERETTL